MVKFDDGKKYDYDFKLNVLDRLGLGSELTKIDCTGEIESWLMVHYVLNTLAVNMSKRNPNGFISALQIKLSSQAECFFNEMTEGVLIQFCDNANDLIEKIKLMQNVLSLLQVEFLLLTLSEKQYLDNLLETMVECSELSSLNDEKPEKLIKIKFRKLDALYSNIRNAIAHGQFRIFNVNSNDYFRFYTENRRNKISSLGQISYKRMENWIQIASTRTR